LYSTKSYAGLYSISSIYFFLFFIILENYSDEKINFFIGIDTLFFLFFPLVIIGIVNINVSGNNIGGEELNFWIIKVAPISTKKMLRIKVIYSLIINMVCGTIGMIILYFVLKPGPLYLIFGLFLLILFSWGESTLGTSIGAFFPEFKPSQSSKNNITFLGILLILITFIVYMLVFFGIVIGILFAGAYFSWPSLISFLLIIALELIVALILYNVLVNLSARRLNRLEWKY